MRISSFRAFASVVCIFSGGKVIERVEEGSIAYLTLRNARVNEVLLIVVLNDSCPLDRAFTRSLSCVSSSGKDTCENVHFL